MGVRNLPELDRVFVGSSLLGLPATFTGRPYSLTAVTVVESDIVHLPREEFLQLMRERLDLCREATDMLGHGVFCPDGAHERAFWPSYQSPFPVQQYSAAAVEGL